MKKALKIFIFLLLVLLTLLGAFYIYVHFFVSLTPPQISEQLLKHNEVHVEENGRTIDENWLRQDSMGIWEMYIEGEPFDRGQAIGLLATDLLDYQENVFVEQVEEIVPNRIYRSFLLHAIRYYNRNIDDFIPLEFKEEIYGVSLYAPDAHQHFGNNYERKVSYHGAHDIGHAFQNMGFVSGCTALASLDSSGKELLLGRNFDFYVGDDFAKNKVVACVRPDRGHAFISLTWAGMIGIVSGMNEHGLAVVLNAGPSEMPKGARTPVTLIAREIVQYASSIDEAISIAKKRDVFVSENFIIASGRERRVITIEKSPKSTVVFEDDVEQFACSNHFLSAQNEGMESNISAKTRSSSASRYQQVMKLMSQAPVNKVEDIARILRSTTGIDSSSLGLGNELAINQLTGHHSIIFNTTKKHVYIAAVPSQNGPYLKYDLDEIFNNRYKQPQRLWSEALPAAAITSSEEYDDFLIFKNKKIELQQAIDRNESWSADSLDAFIALNPDHYLGYMLAGTYYEQHGIGKKAQHYFEQALMRQIPWAHERESIEKKLQHVQ